LVYRKTSWVFILSSIQRRPRCLNLLPRPSLQPSRRDFADGGVQEFLSCPNPSERVLKLAEPAGRVIGEGVDIVVRARPVAVTVDTTAAGDSFAAAYIAARLSGRSLECSVEAGHRLAGTVVCHPGAIIPASAMPADLNFVSTGTVQEKRP
jgi:sugar/nucleoside kinase (ribokinase family)